KKQFASLPNVHYVKGVDNVREVCKMLTAADCYVLASGLDCCPTTVLEASLMRKPVIASRVGGVPEIILENQTGWTVENDDINNWVEKIRLAVTDLRLNRNLGDTGRDWVSKEFGWATIAKQVEDILIAETD